jgi:FAD/FMN-containing dehydrogenase
VAAEIVSEKLFVRFAGNEKGVAYQVEQARKLLKDAEVVMDDGDLWKGIVVERRMQTLGGPAKQLMERIKRQLDPKNILTAD